MQRRHFHKIFTATALLYGANPLWAKTAAPPDIAEAIVDFALNVKYQDLPPSVVENTKKQVIDTIGVALAGNQEAGVQELGRLAQQIGGAREARIWGSEVYLPAHDAARINATMAHALDYDDTHEPSFMHPGVVCMPTAMAMAEMLPQLSGQDIIKAVAVGTDISCRLALAAQPGVNAFKVGWHNTTVYGYFSSALIASMLMGLNKAQTISALGIAFHQAAGNAQSHVDGALTKRMGPGFATYDGIYAARLAQLGVRGPHRVFEGVKGFYHQYHQGNYNRAVILNGLGQEFAIDATSFKPWPSCRGSHTAADAALQIFQKQPVAIADVEKITITNGPDDFKLLSTPLEKKQNPQTTVDAQFSNPWVVAVAAAYQEVKLRHFTKQALQDPKVQAWSRLVQTQHDDQLVSAQGGPSATVITVQLKNGQQLQARVDKAKGEPYNPMSGDEMRNKYLDCLAFAGIPEAQARSSLQRLSQLEREAQAGQVLSALVVPKA